MAPAPFPWNLVPDRIVNAYQIRCQALLGKEVALGLNYALLRVWEQVFASVPITLYLVLFLGIVFQTSVYYGGVAVGGIIAAIFGLTFFLEGLKVAFMPMGEIIGRELPSKFPLPVVLLFSAVIGVAVTYAEPAIAALRPLGSFAKREDAPYLSWLLEEGEEWLVLCIGLGVGVAAVLGMLRLIRGWSLRPLILVTLLPTLALSAFMMWGPDPYLASVLALAWDCGAVTTGPVTVPILLSIGIGTAASMSEDAARNPMAGFGIVTLASILPILFVEILACVLALAHSPEQIIRDGAALANATASVLEQPGISEAVGGLRATTPLAALLIFIIVLFLRAPLPSPTFHALVESEAPAASGAGAIAFVKRMTITSLVRVRMLLRRYVQRFRAARAARRSFESMRRRSRSFSMDRSPSRPSLPDVVLEAMRVHHIHVPPPPPPPSADLGGLASSRARPASMLHTAPAAIDLHDLRAARAAAGAAPRLSLAAEHGPARMVPSVSSVALSDLGRASAMVRTASEEELDAALAAVAAAHGHEPEHRPAVGARHSHDGPHGQGDGHRPPPDDAALLPVGADALPPMPHSPVRRDRPVSPPPPPTPSSAASGSAAALFASPAARAMESRGTGPVMAAAAADGDAVAAEEHARGHDTDDAEAHVRFAPPPALPAPPPPPPPPGDDAAAGVPGADDSGTTALLVVDDGGQGGAGAAGDGDGEDAELADEEDRRPAFVRWLSVHGLFVLGVVLTVLGMIVFNFGLTNGFTYIGIEVGLRLPGVLLPVHIAPHTPLLPFGGGLAVVLAYIFGLGVLATRAEPALNVTGEKVEELSGGSFSKAALIWAVCIGVASGMTLGMCQILFALPIIYITLAGYAVALALTFLSDETMINVAWDSAGVTTGPVTVPFVLALGLSFGDAVHASNGFGVLTSASVCPIISVLAFGQFVRLRAWLRAWRARRGVLVPSASATSTAVNPYDRL